MEEEEQSRCTQKHVDENCQVGTPPITGFGTRNESGGEILEFAVAYDLAVANTYFKKRKEHLVTFKSGSNESPDRLLYA